ncbi:hypothetical protein D3C87_1652370 [compost metagenome]
MPRVGSSRIKTLGSENSHLANTTFCWLPPESLSTVCKTSGLRMRRRAWKSTATALSASSFITQRLDTVARLAMLVLRVMLSPSTRPAPLRSSVA